MLRVGALHYLNSLPLFAALEVGDNVLRYAVPSINNESLRRGFLDVALISSYDYLLHQDAYEILPTCCIASTGTVMSVSLFSKVPPRQLDGATVAVTRVSATSAKLLEVLCSYHWQVHPRYVPLESATPSTTYDAFLLIGDGCLATTSPPGWYHTDLGLAWQEFTSLPFVYAVVAANKVAFAQRPREIVAFSQQLDTSLAWAEEHPTTLLALATHLYPFSSQVIDAYFQCLIHRFSPALWQGLQRFHELAQHV